MQSVISRLAALFVVAALSGCAGMAEYPLGIPVSATGKFYPSMEAVAASHGYQVVHQPQSLNVDTELGWLQYMQRNGSIVLVVIADTDGLTDAQIEKRKIDMKRLSDDLVKEARRNAREASAFD